MLLALKNANFALAHELAEPADVVDRHTRVLATVMDDDRAVDVFVAEADGVLGLEADDEVGRWVGARGGSVPDGESEPLVESALAFAFSEGECCEARFFSDRVVGVGHGQGEGAGVGEDLVHHKH